MEETWHDFGGVHLQQELLEEAVETLLGAAGRAQLLPLGVEQLRQALQRLAILTVEVHRLREEARRLLHLLLLQRVQPVHVLHGGTLNLLHALHAQALRLRQHAAVLRRQLQRDQRLLLPAVEALVGVQRRGQHAQVLRRHQWEALLASGARDGEKGQRGRQQGQRLVLRGVAQQLAGEVRAPDLDVVP